MNEEAIWLSETDVTALVSIGDAIGALESGLKAMGQGQGQNVPKALGGFGDGTSIHSLGSALPELGYCGYKNWIHTKRGAKAVYTLFQAHEGKLLAIMEANALGQLRTASMTGLGTKWMAPATARDMALIGTGRQALAQVAAVNAVRPLKRIRVWSPTAENREAFVEHLRPKTEAELINAGSLDEATAGAELITMVTRAKTPFLHSNHLPQGVHLNAVGAILPTHAEFHQDVFSRVGAIAVDDPTGIQKASREFIDYFDHGAGQGQWSRVQGLSSLIASQQISPRANGDISLFKSVGMGLSDLSVAILVYQRAQSQGLGHALPLTAAAPLRW